MSELVADCPRCGAQSITFDLLQQNYLRSEYDWKSYFETFCICRKCQRSTVFVLSLKSYDHRDAVSKGALLSLMSAVNTIMEVEGFIALKDQSAIDAPEHLPTDIEAAFREGAACYAVNCPNAAGTMFRLCVDLATRSRLPPDGTPGISSKQRRDLGLRLPWLFDNKLLPEELRNLSTCIKEDGNDGAHAGTLKKEDAADLLDFTVALLERLFTEPKRLELAERRRKERRAKKDG